MKKITFILLTILLFAFTFSDDARHSTVPDPQTKTGSESNITAPYEATNFTVSGRQVLLNGHPFFAQGVGYQPVPVGQHPNDYPNGDYFLSDYAGIYKPDLDKMRAMGVNALKIYSWYPDKDHTDFLNYAYNGGTNPIYVAVGYFMPPGTIIGNFDEKLSLFKKLAENTKMHPAIMGYMLGNENVGNDRDNPVFWNKLNQIAAALKSIAPNKLTFTALVDDAMKSVIAGNNSMTSLDVWGINVFRGKSLTDLYSTFLSASKKPLFITELGFPASIRDEHGNGAMMPENAEKVGDYCKTVMTEVEDNSSDDEPDDPVAGVFWFMFCDEWWKQDCPTCSKSTHDFTSTGPTDPFPGKWWDEEWFGLYTADRQPRAAVGVLKNLWK